RSACVRHVVRRFTGRELLEEPQPLLRERHRETRMGRHAISRLKSRADNTRVTRATTPMMRLACQTTLVPRWPWKMARMPLVPQANGFQSATFRTHSGATESGIRTPASSETGWETDWSSVP